MLYHDTTPPDYQHNDNKLAPDTAPEDYSDNHNKLGKITLRLLNSYGDNTTLLKFDGKRKVWIVFCAYYPHITYFVNMARNRHIEFSLDERGFRAEFPLDNKYLNFLPYYGRGKFQTRNMPIELQRAIGKAVQAHMMRKRKHPEETKEQLYQDLKTLYKRHNFTPESSKVTSPEK